jgi:hypothetical protein
MLGTSSVCQTLPGLFETTRLVGFRNYSPGSQAHVSNTRLTSLYNGLPGTSGIYNIHQTDTIYRTCGNTHQGHRLLNRLHQAAVLFTRPMVSLPDPIRQPSRLPGPWSPHQIVPDGCLSYIPLAVISSSSMIIIPSLNVYLETRSLYNLSPPKFFVRRDLWRHLPGDSVTQSSGVFSMPSLTDRNFKYQ